MASRILVVVLVLIVLAAVGVVVWLSMQPTAPTSAPSSAAAATLLNATAVRQPLGMAPIRRADPVTSAGRELERSIREQVTGLLE